MQAYVDSDFFENINSDMSRVVIKGMKLGGCKLSHKNLSLAHFEDCFCRRLDFSFSLLERAEFTRCNLEQADFTSVSSMALSSFRFCNLDSITLSPDDHILGFVQKDGLEGSSLRNTDLSHTWFRGFIFSQMKLDCSNLSECFLPEVMSDCSLYSTILNGSNWTEVKRIERLRLKNAKLLAVVGLPQKVIECVEDKDMEGVEVSFASLPRLKCEEFNWR